MWLVKRILGELYLERPQKQIGVVGGSRVVDVLFHRKMDILVIPRQ